MKILTHDVTFITDDDVIVDVSEEMAPGTTIFSVFAFDPDQGPNGEVTYKLEDLEYEGILSLDLEKLGKYLPYFIILF